MQGKQGHQIQGTKIIILLVVEGHNPRSTWSCRISSSCLADSGPSATRKCSRFHHYVVTIPRVTTSQRNLFGYLAEVQVIQISRTIEWCAKMCAWRGFGILVSISSGKVDLYNLRPRSVCLPELCLPEQSQLSTKLHHLWCRSKSRFALMEKDTNKVSTWNDRWIQLVDYSCWTLEKKRNTERERGRA